MNTCETTGYGNGCSYEIVWVDSLPPIGDINKLYIVGNTGGYNYILNVGWNQLFTGADPAVINRFMNKTVWVNEDLDANDLVNLIFISPTHAQLWIATNTTLSRTNQWTINLPPSTFSVLTLNENIRFNFGQSKITQLISNISISEALFNTVMLADITTVNLNGGALSIGWSSVSDLIGTGKLNAAFTYFSASVILDDVVANFAFCTGNVEVKTGGLLTTENHFGLITQESTGWTNVGGTVDSMGFVGNLPNTCNDNQKVAQALNDLADLPFDNSDTTLASTTMQTALAELSDNADTLYRGEFYAYAKSILFNITVTDTYHAVTSITAGDLTAGTLENFTFNEGRVVDTNITSEASGTDGKLRLVCSEAHGLITGSLVVLGNMNNAGHNKPTYVTIDDVNPTTEFLCTNINYVANAGNSAGTVTKPAMLIAGVNAAGNYVAHFTINGTAAAANKAWKFELNTNLLANDKVVSERTSTNTLGEATAGGLIDIVSGDKIWLSGKNTTDTSDYTIKNCNLNLHK